VNLKDGGDDADDLDQLSGNIETRDLSI